MLGRNKKPKAYYRSTIFSRVWRAIKHPVKLTQNIRKYGFWNVVVRATLLGYLFPPDIREWKVARGWKRKHTENATPIIPVN